ncbi:MAG: DUF4179 domain-containing protein [Chloroflexales bacterium]|nr:DUF4179 domain-containing protein [Chloroflexales bacterium]
MTDHKHDLRKQYADILGNTADAAMLKLVEQLHADVRLAYQDSEPPQLRTVIDKLAEAQSNHVPAPRRTQLVRRFSALGLALCSILALIGASYAAFPVLERAFQLRTGTGAILTGGLGKEINVAQSIDGFTVTVRHVYADPNQIVIGYTVSGPPERTFNNVMAWGEYTSTSARSPFLLDQYGNEFRGGLGGAQPGMQDGVAAALLTYDGVGIQPDVSELQVQLRIAKLTAYERLGDDEFQDVIVTGPFVFDLTIPIEPGRTANLQQVSDVGGTKVTLERVVTTPTGTRVSLRGAGPNADVQLTVAGKTYALHPPDGQAKPFQWAPDSQWEYITGDSFQDNYDEWELVVQPAQPIPRNVDPQATYVRGGPWIFRFVVP